MERSIFGFFYGLFMCHLSYLCRSNLSEKAGWTGSFIFAECFYKLGKFHSCFLYDTFLTCTKENK